MHLLVIKHKIIIYIYYMYYITISFTVGILFCDGPNDKIRYISQLQNTDYKNSKDEKELSRKNCHSLYSTWKWLYGVIQTNCAVSHVLDVVELCVKVWTVLK